MADGEDKVCKSRRKKFFATRRGKRLAVVFGMIVVILVLVMKFCIGTRPVKFSKDRVHKITISIDYFTSSEMINGFAEITDPSEFSHVLETVNSLQTCYPKFYRFMYEPPNAIIITKDKEGHEIERINIYDDVLRIYRDNGQDYKICMTEYDKLEKLCRRYGYVDYYDY